LGVLSSPPSIQIKVKVFLSWSGETSRKAACVLRDWLPSVVQTLEPYVSSEDIDKGARWSTDISAELDASSFGILCVTPENLPAPWLNFEAGALSKSIDKARVSPFLFGVKRSEVTGPILQFQSTIFDEDDVRKLVQSLNQADETSRLDAIRLDVAFGVWWPRLRDSLTPLLAEAAEMKKATATPGAAPAGAMSLTNAPDILEQLLELSRQQQRILNDPESLLPPRYLENVLRRHVGLPRSHPAYRDLRKQYRDLQTLASGLDDTTTPHAEIKDRVHRLGTVIEYILDRLGGGARNSFRTLGDLDLSDKGVSYSHSGV
jgi:hypothetical protein